MRFSILSTLVEALSLCARNFDFLVLAAFLINISDLLTSFKVSSDFFVSLKYVISILLSVILNAVGESAILTILCRESGENRWIVIAQAIRRYTGELVGVNVLLTLIFLALFIPAMVLLAVFSFPLWSFFALGLFVFFLKYALAAPLVVAENMRAWPALRKSWQMTKNRFSFVFGCYVIFGGIEWLIQFGAGSLHLHGSFEWIVRYMLDVLDTYWIVLSWVMYLRIKEGDENLPVASEDPAPI